MISKNPKPIIGMLHAPALPGSPRYEGDWSSILSFVLKDAETLAKGGVDALIIENYGDLPFFPDKVPSETVAHMAVLARTVKKKFKLPLGINILRNDGVSALAIAKTAGADFVRVNILTGARLTDQGIIQGKAHEVMRFRKKIDANSIRVFADVAVKYSSAISERTLEAEVEETLHRSGADGLIVSGAGTGKPVDLERLKRVKKIASEVSVWIGSGVTVENIDELSPFSDGFIVGSSLKPSLEAPIDEKRVKKLVERLHRGRLV
ncbi:MAG: phosphorybosylanthranilate isomerase [Proteobacteria bacterium]|nr:phosphorybosylanthranilate isomerase [Pseudomonadota bacterium]